MINILFYLTDENGCKTRTGLQITLVPEAQVQEG